MYQAVRKKFETHSQLHELLLATGDEEIVENAPGDYYWGCGKDSSGQIVGAALYDGSRKRFTIGKALIGAYLNLKRAVVQPMVAAHRGWLHGSMGMTRTSSSTVLYVIYSQLSAWKSATCTVPTGLRVRPPIANETTFLTKLIVLPPA